jgi:phosphoglycolate phosphatase
VKALLWDLDGTLTSPRVGIVRCIQFALEKAGLAPPGEEELLWCIGPPLHHSFAKLAPDHDPMKLVAFYRERFAEKGLFENEVYPGIPGVLAGLRDHRHFVATSKPEVYARKIVEHFGLGAHFEQVYGSELSGERTDKGELLRHLLALERLSEAVMIGDREHDVLGARTAGLPCVGVLWGYGSREELERAGAAAIAEQPAELERLLRGVAGA